MRWTVIPTPRAWATLIEIGGCTCGSDLPGAHERLCGWDLLGWAITPAEAIDVALEAGFTVDTQVVETTEEAA